MNFDTKYLIRWGIPGWILIAYVIVYFMIRGTIDIKEFSKDGLQLIGSTLAVFPVGVIVGYLIYQMYFLLLIVLEKFYKPDKSIDTLQSLGLIVPKQTKEAYFFIEFTWHRALTKLEPEKMNYIAERYRHLLTRKHEIGSLFISLCLCSSVSVAAVQHVIKGSLSPVFLTFVGINFCLIIYSFYIFKYYSLNTDYFMAENLRVLLKAE